MGHYASEMGEGDAECRWTREFLFGTYIPQIERERGDVRAKLNEANEWLAMAYDTVRRGGTVTGEDLESLESVLTTTSGSGSVPEIVRLATSG